MRIVKQSVTLIPSEVPGKWAAKFIVSLGTARELFMEGMNERLLLDPLTLVTPEWYRLGIEVDPRWDPLRYKWYNSMAMAEQAYLELKEEGLDYLGVLPLDLGVELIMSGTRNEWDGLFNRPMSDDAKAVTSLSRSLLRGIMSKTI